MVKAYLRYVEDDVLNCLVGKHSNTITTFHNNVYYLITACNEVINVVNIHTAEIVKKFYDREATYGYVTSMALFDDANDLRGKLLAVGFSSGHVIIYDFDHILHENSATQNVEFIHKFNLHKSGVNCLTFDKTGSVLASGGLDTYIIVYDIIEGVSLYKLMGHKDSITQLQFHLFQYEKKDHMQEEHLIHSNKARRFEEMLVSSSKDTSLKIWDLESQFCAQTLMDTNQKAYSFIIYKEMILLGAEDEKIRIYKCGIKQKVDDLSRKILIYADQLGSFDKNGNERVIDLSIAYDNSYITITSADGNIEIIKENDQKDIYKKLLRVARRQAKKKRLHPEMEGEGDQEAHENAKINKEKIKENVLTGDFDAKYLFSSVCSLTITDSKVRTTSLFKYK